MQPRYDQLVQAHKEAIKNGDYRLANLIFQEICWLPLFHTEEWLPTIEVIEALK
jgi:hypothetical protein